MKVKNDEMARHHDSGSDAVTANPIYDNADNHDYMHLKKCKYIQF